MATISASAVKDLREKTGVGMMEAKKALEEAAGDFEQAVDILRKKGLSAAAKKATRVASEGMIASFLEGNGNKVGVLIEVNSETDFVAKNADFQSFAKGLAELVAGQKPADVPELSQLTMTGENVEARRNALIQKIGENIAVRRFVRYETSGRIAMYLHGSRIGVMVDYTGDEQLGKDLAMHIAAASPLFINRDTVPADFLQREREVYEAQAKESGKPAAVIGKIVDGKLEKFYTDTCLMDQVYIKDPDGKLKIKDLLKKAGANVAVSRFVRYQLGEGIEKKKENFAEEVAAQLK